MGVLLVADVLCLSSRPNLAIVTFSKAVRQVNPSLANDALHRANYSLSDRDSLESITIEGVAPYGARAVMLSLGAPLVLKRRYALDVVNVEATDGDKLPGPPISIFIDGVASAENVPAPSLSLTGLHDSFDRADNAGSAGVADSGQPWVVLGGGTWGINSNELYHSSASGDIVVADANLSDCVMEVTCKSTSNLSFGLVLRASDVDNYILANFWTGDGGWRLYQNAGGALTPLSAAYALASVVAGDVMRFKAVAGVITLERNGVQILTGPSVFNLTETLCGFRGTGDGDANRLDDLSVVGA